MLKLLFVLFLVICCYANATVYNVVLSFQLADPDVGCMGDDALKLEEITTEALTLAGMTLSGASDNWKYLNDKEYNGNGADNGNKKGWDKNGMNRFLLQEERRDLGGCGGRCYTMCQATGLGRWCACCSCCGSRRRMLRVLNDDVGMPEVEIAATEHALELLEEETEHISCLAKDYDVVAIVERTQDA